jgi:hypothetical protein
MVHSDVIEEYAKAAQRLAEQAAAHRASAERVDRDWTLQLEGHRYTELNGLRSAWADAEKRLAEAQDEFRRALKRRMNELNGGRH